jgi:hypothetical protein
LFVCCYARACARSRRRRVYSTQYVYHWLERLLGAYGSWITNVHTIIREPCTRAQARVCACVYMCSRVYWSSCVRAHTQKRYSEERLPVTAHRCFCSFLFVFGFRVQNSLLYYVRTYICIYVVAVETRRGNGAFLTDTTITHHLGRSIFSGRTHSHVLNHIFLLHAAVVPLLRPYLGRR